MKNRLVISPENKQFPRELETWCWSQTAFISQKFVWHVSDSWTCCKYFRFQTFYFHLTASRPERECPSRRYVFERHPRKKLKLPVSDIKEITAANRSDCEDKCLSEFSFVCRSANFDSTMRTCTLSRFTRRTHPELLEDDPNSDYLENTCLNGKQYEKHFQKWWMKSNEMTFIA